VGANSPRRYNPAGNHEPVQRGDRGEARLWRLGTALAVSFTLAVVGLAGLAWLAWVLLGVAGYRHHGAPALSDTVGVLQLVFATVAGAGALVALIVAYRRQKITEADSAHDRTRVFNERFTTIATQLGDAQPAVQLAGVHAMAGLADDWKHNRQICVDVLCAYLRLPYEPDPGEDATPAERIAYRANREVRHTIIRLITAHLRADAAVSWEGLDFDFTGVVFDGGDFGRAVFSDGIMLFNSAIFADGTVDFDNARFFGGTVSFHGARFADAEVRFGATWFAGAEVGFDNAEFAGGTVSFERAQFSGGAVGFGNARFFGGTVSFDNARFSGSQVGFDNAEFSGGQVGFDNAEFVDGQVGFSGAKFVGGRVNFHRAEFSDGQVGYRNAKYAGGQVRFDKAEFSGGQVGFDNARFSGGTVHFDYAKFSGGQVGFDNARFSGGTVHFDYAEFVGSEVSFGSDFSGGTVSFSGTEFAGGQVDFSGAAYWATAPTFNWESDPPFGDLLPVQLSKKRNWR
jgi:hypothetical protein